MLNMAVNVFKVCISDQTQPQNNICWQEEAEDHGCQSLKIRMSD